jgi:branched-chain amino acid transport system permease protein
MNLAHGNVFALTSVVVAYLALLLGVRADAPLGVRLGALLLLALAGMVAGAGLNAAVERLAFRPFRGRDRLAPLVASVGLSFVFFQAAIWWFQLTTPPPTGIVGHVGVDLPLLAVPDLVPPIELGTTDVSFTLKDLVVLVLAGAVVGAVGLVLRRSRGGRMVRAAAEDAEMAALCGVDPARAQLVAFAAAGGLSGLGAAMFAAYYGGAYAQHGLRSGLAAMTAAILGGVGNPRGALLGGMTIGVFGAFSDYLLDAKWTPVLVLLLLVALLALRPTGLLGTGQVGRDEPIAAPADGRVRGERWVAAALLALALAFPLFDVALGWGKLTAAAAALRLVALAIGLNVVVGLAGLLDLGYAAFVALGGYTAALTTGSGSRLMAWLPELVRSPWLAVVLAGGVAGLFGAAFGLPSLRTRGEYLAIVTLAFGEIVPSVIWHVPEWTGGPRGVSGIPAARLEALDGASPLGSYVLALALVLAAAVASARWYGARLGRSWRAVRDDDVAAAAASVRPWRAKLGAFAIGAAIAGLVGALQAGQYGYVEPEQFDLTVSLTVLAAVVIGSRWGLIGVVLAALAVAGYERLLVDFGTGAARVLGGSLGWSALAAVDLRGQSYVVFGVALYVATLVRGRAASGGRSRS